MRAASRTLQILTAGTCLLALAACGGSNPAGRGTKVGNVSGDGYSACMRAHGVPNFPDPLPGGGISIPSSINVTAPAFIAAQKACGGGPGGGPALAQPSEAQRRLAVEFSQCMRRHGLNNFPDPTQVPPTFGQLQSKETVIGRGGMFWVLQGGLYTTTAFSQAASACGLHIGRGVRSPAP